MTNRCAIYVGLALLLSSTAGEAETIRLAQANDVLAPAEIVGIVRSAGFRPIGRPGRDGANYVLRAIDRHGNDVQVIVDAEDADILHVRRLGADAFAAPREPRYQDYFFGNVPRPPRSVPVTRATPPKARAAAGPPVPRARPNDVTGSINTAPTTAAAPAPPPAPAAAPAKTEVPPVVGFE